jgi:O-antigen ligase
VKQATYPASAILLALAAAAAVLHNGGLETSSLAVAAGLMLLMLMLGICSDGNARAKPLPTLPMTLASGCLLLMALWLALMPGLSQLPGTSVTVGWVVAALPLAYLLAVVTLRETRDWTAGLSLVRVVAALVMTVGVIDFLVVRSRPFSVFEDVNAFAAFCNVFALPALARLHTRLRSDGMGAALRSGNAAFVLLALACLAATASRGGQLSFLLGLSVLGLLLVRHDRSAWKTIAASVLVFVALLAAIAPFQQMGSSLSRFTSMDSDSSTSDRLEMLKSTWRMVEDGPWYGSGLGTYKVRYLMYRSPDEVSTTGDLAHNDYLQMLAEGGPILAGLLALLALSIGFAALRLWRSARTTTADSPQFIESAGLVAALSCLFGHAALNFIFYVMPLALIAGLYLGRLDVLRGDVRQLEIGRHVSRPMLMTLVGGLTLWLIATLGLQSAYQAMTTGQCRLRLCTQLAGDEPFYGRYSALLIATQPSYLPAREWFVNAYTAAAARATDDRQRNDSARMAARELADQIRRYPAVPYPYRDLASLLIKYPAVADAIGPGVSDQPVALLREAVRRNPLDVRARTQLATTLDAGGQTEAAFELLHDDGMRWWKVQPLSDSGRADLLKAAIPLALKLGRCADAAEMARGLAAFLPNDPLAVPVDSDAATCRPNSKQTPAVSG